MKTVTKYIANDGVEFMDRDKCLLHERKVEQIVSEVSSHNDPAMALISFVEAIKLLLNISVPSHEGYIELFSSHKPCSFHCTLWRFVVDYSKDYPTVYKLFSDTLDRYIELYGEPAKCD